MQINREQHATARSDGGFDTKKPLSHPVLLQRNTMSPIWFPEQFSPCSESYHRNDNVVCTRLVLLPRSNRDRVTESDPSAISLDPRSRNFARFDSPNLMMSHGKNDFVGAVPLGKPATDDWLAELTGRWESATAGQE